METPTEAVDVSPRRRWHVSTGRLTERQSETIERWRERLLEQRPLPGQTRVDVAGAVMYGLDNRPRASHSDAIAAAVDELLRRPPSGSQVARYAISMRKLLDPHSQPVSFYLVDERIDVYRGVLERAEEWSARIHAEARQAAEDAHREADNDAAREAAGMVSEGRLLREGLALRDYRLAAGTVARMAIDAWAERDVDEVAVAAGRYAEHAHDQRHRARRDIRQPRRSR